MPEILTESFCERCGTRYTFESAAPARPRSSASSRPSSKGLKNYVLSDDTSLDEAMAAARSDEERELTAQQLDAFHSTFNFCMTCRQYTCANCWNAGRGPLPDLRAAPRPRDHAGAVPGPAASPPSRRSRSRPGRRPTSRPTRTQVAAATRRRRRRRSTRPTGSTGCRRPPTTSSRRGSPRPRPTRSQRPRRRRSSRRSTSPRSTAAVPSRDRRGRGRRASRSPTAAERDAAAVAVARRAAPPAVGRAAADALEAASRNRTSSRARGRGSRRRRAAEVAAEPTAIVDAVAADRPSSRSPKPPRTSDDRAAAATLATAALLGRFRPGQSIDAELEAYEAAVAATEAAAAARSPEPGAAARTAPDEPAELPALEARRSRWRDRGAEPEPVAPSRRPEPVVAEPARPLAAASPAGARARAGRSRGARGRRADRRRAGADAADAASSPTPRAVEPSQPRADRRRRRSSPPQPAPEATPEPARTDVVEQPTWRIVAPDPTGAPHERPRAGRACRPPRPRSAARGSQLPPASRRSGPSAGMAEPNAGASLAQRTGRAVGGDARRSGPPRPATSSRPSQGGAGRWRPAVQQLRPVALGDRPLLPPLRHPPGLTAPVRSPTAAISSSLEHPDPDPGRADQQDHREPGSARPAPTKIVAERAVDEVRPEQPRRDEHEDLGDRDDQRRRRRSPAATSADRGGRTGGTTR